MFSKKELYIAFLQASSVRYSSNALSDVAPIEISHDVLSKWLKTAQLRPAEVWYESKNYLKKISRHCLLKNLLALLIKKITIEEKKKLIKEYEELSCKKEESTIKTNRHVSKEKKDKFNEASKNLEQFLKKHHKEKISEYKKEVDEYNAEIQSTLILACQNAVDKLRKERNKRYKREKKDKLFKYKSSRPENIETYVQNIESEISSLSELKPADMDFDNKYHGSLEKIKKITLKELRTIKSDEKNKSILEIFLTYIGFQHDEHKNQTEMLKAKLDSFTSKKSR